MFLQLVLLLFAALLYYIHFKTRKADKMMKGIKRYPRYIPLIGNISQGLLVAFKGTKGVSDFFLELNHFQEDTRTSIFGVQMFLAIEAETINAILSSPYALNKALPYKFLEFGNKGIVSVKEVKWRKLRPQLNKLFNQKYFEEYLNSINNKTKIFIQIMKDTKGKTINIEEYFSRFLWDTVSEIFFGVHENIQIEKRVTMSSISGRIAQLAHLRTFAVWLHPNFIFKHSAMKKYLNKIGLKCFEHTKDIMKQSLETYEERVAAESQNSPIRKPYAVMYKELFESEYNKKCTLEELALGTNDLLVAATDTTGINMSTLMYFLAVYPEYQEKVYEEVMGLYTGGDWTRQQLSRMPYLDMAIHESLRHCSPYVLGRYASRDIDIGKCTIPRGTGIFCLLRKNQMNEKYIKDPTVFNPDNFLPEKVKERPKNIFTPFSVGPRNCPGATFSLFFSKCVVAEVVRQFRVSTRLNPKDVEYTIGLMTEFQGGYPVTLTQRT